MLSKLTRGNQITIPKAIIERTGLKEGKDYVDVEYIHGVICLKPIDIEERISKEDWEKFKKKMLAKENGDLSLSAKAAEHFLEKRVKERTK